MNHTEVLVLNGSPGSGKTTLANAIAEKLRETDIPHAVIDVDELTRVYPEAGNSLGWRNLRAMWRNYFSPANPKVIIPVCIDNQRDLEELQDATPCGKFTICELVADEIVLKERVTRREPNEYWQSKLRGLVENYIRKDSTAKFGDFQVRTDDRSVDETVKHILNRLGWNQDEAEATE